MAAASGVSMSDAWQRFGWAVMQSEVRARLRHFKTELRTTKDPAARKELKRLVVAHEHWLNENTPRLPPEFFKESGR